MQIIKVILAQLLALCVLAGGVWGAAYWIAPPYPDQVLVLGQGVLALLFTWWLRLPKWWRWMQFLFPVVLWWGLQAQIHPAWALVLFLVVVLVFKNAFFGGVPLYLSNRTTQKAVAQLIKERQLTSVMDLGCGTASNSQYWSELATVERSDGVETAPLVYFLAKFRCRKSDKCHILMQDMWTVELLPYDLVYAFLSPKPMERLWCKVNQELQDGAVFVSNSFAVPDVEPTEIWELADSRKTLLYIYVINKNSNQKENQ